MQGIRDLIILLSSCLKLIPEIYVEKHQSSCSRRPSYDPSRVRQHRELRPEDRPLHRSLDTLAPLASSQSRSGTMSFECVPWVELNTPSPAGLRFLAGSGTRLPQRCCHLCPGARRSWEIPVSKTHRTQPLPSSWSRATRRQLLCPVPDVLRPPVLWREEEAPQATCFLSSSQGGPGGEK